MEFIPHSYQQRGVDHLLTNPKAALFWEMGLGKTATTLLALAEMVKTGKAKKILIIGPLRVITSTWPSEIDKWDNINLTYKVIKGTPVQRKAAVEETVDIHLINYEQLLWLVEEYEDDWPWDTMVFDESSKMKSPNAKRFKAIKKVIKK